MQPASSNTSNQKKKTRKPIKLKQLKHKKSSNKQQSSESSESTIGSKQSNQAESGTNEKNQTSKQLSIEQSSSQSSPSTQSNQANQANQQAKQGDFFTILKERSLTGSEVDECHDYFTLFQFLLAGDTIILIDGYAKGFTIGSKGFEKRGVEESSSTTVIRGPKDGFSETLRTNTSLIRRRLKDPSLWIENMVIGEKTHTDIAVCYMKGIVNDDVVQEVKKRLKDIEIDAILESGYIEELIQDKTYTPFPTINNSERPDAVCAGLLEGRVAIMVDGTPFVLLVPSLFVDFFQSSEDYYQRSDIGSALRLLRFVCFFLALLTPSAYIALTTFHQEMIPTQLLISLAAQREGVPFPAYVEALMMEITFEILREAGTRMPRAVGNAISIVGALVLGQAAVEAGIVSSAMVIVVSLTAISSFVFPSFNISISVRLLRFIFMTLAAMFGLVGIILGLLVMVMHMASLRSFGIPYLSPMGPFIPGDQKDSLIRLPLWRLRTRPKLISQKDMEREDTEPAKPKQK
ncbi:spore germination protein [Salinibacillus xinjiangensis]|uniref:spore germination protein n=1 Tax=Salinibacillus xinjiangensis TaxID=1229268 RepID=UPI00389A2744